MIRYFRSTDAVLEQVRLSLDSAWGFPDAGTKTSTALDPASTSPHDEQGRVYVVVSAAYCEYIMPSQMLPELLASGVVEEIDNAEYERVFPLPNARGVS